MFQYTRPANQRHTYAPTRRSTRSVRGDQIIDLEPPGGSRRIKGGPSDFSRFDPRPERPHFSNFGPPAEQTFYCGSKTFL